MPSSYQKAILDHLADSTGHVVIHATAGAGKTTVLTQISAAQSADSRQLFLAFARNAATELKQRLPAGVDTRTVHSLGRQVLAAHLKRLDVSLLPPQPLKYRKLAARIIKERLGVRPGVEASGFLAELAGVARLQLIDPDDEQALEAAAEEAGLFLPRGEPDTAQLLPLLPHLLEAGMAEAERGVVDFGDMLFVPLRKRLPVPSFDLVCVDEAQDYSAAALELTLSLASAGARLVFVGDPRQSIFGFAGARPDAMDLIARRLHAKILPLSVTYRCPRLHVELARVIAPEMEAAPGAAPGEVHVIQVSELEAWVRPRDLVLCRLNAPLLAACLRLAAMGIPAVVRGADLVERLKQVARRAFKGGIRAPLVQLSVWLQQEQERAGNGSPAGARLADEVECLRLLCVQGGELPRLLKDVEERIEAAFTEQPDSVVLSSIHRAKGQEADRVLLLHPELLPAPYARTVTALRGEACVQFVALTRARKELVLVGGPEDVQVPPPPASDGSDLDMERDRLLHDWQRVLALARTGRRHRKVIPRSGRRGRNVRPAT